MQLEQCSLWFIFTFQLLHSEMCTYLGQKRGEGGGLFCLTQQLVTELQSFEIPVILNIEVIGF